MQSKEQSALRNILATAVPEGSAQIGLSLSVAALQTLVVDLRAIREMLEEPEDVTTVSEDSGPESLAFFLRSSIEGVLVDHLEPAIRTLARAAATTVEDLDRDWKERRADPRSHLPRTHSCSF